MKLRLAILALVGVALALYLVRYVGWHAVLAAAGAIGWTGFAAFCLCTLGLFLLLGAAWQVLLPAESAPPLSLLVRARLVRDAAAEVLPLSQLGGIALGVRAAILQGMAAPLAAASMIADVTTEMLAQIAYAAAGMAILVTRVPQSSRVAALISGCAIGLVLAVILAALFIALQRRGGEITARLATRVLRRAGQTLNGLSASLETIYRSPARVALSTALHLAGWIGNGAAVWLGFRLMGARVDLAAAIAIESIVYAIRSAAVFIPNALGVQEGAYILLGPIFGVGTDTALAMSVLKRARDIAIGVPVLLMWQAAEGRRALDRTDVRPHAGDGRAQ
ncbi:MAG TPA: lysylphosphatidylglycerol synthase domain-containing protein [Steroidobacteraceae bacterium]|nr:lysylphosphatidylglycerol synthase domain-containing protein [Steroidobacteraceae bacterium]